MRGEVPCGFLDQFRAIINAHRRRRSDFLLPKAAVEEERFVLPFRERPPRQKEHAQRIERRLSVGQPPQQRPCLIGFFLRIIENEKKPLGRRCEFEPTSAE
jgi:hypothetical protein